MEQLNTSKAVLIPLCSAHAVRLKALGFSDNFWPLTNLMGQNFRICSLVAPYLYWQIYHDS